jgi:hypothetical protein
LHGEEEERCLGFDVEKFKEIDFGCCYENYKIGKRKREGESKRWKRRRRRWQRRE